MIINKEYDIEKNIKFVYLNFLRLLKNDNYLKIPTFAILFNNDNMAFSLVIPNKGDNFNTFNKRIKIEVTNKNPKITLNCISLHNNIGFDGKLIITDHSYDNLTSIYYHKGNKTWEGWDEIW